MPSTARVLLCCVVLLAGLSAGQAAVAQAAAAASSATADTSSNDLAAQKVATFICSSCHGPGGVNTAPMFPNLAGQQAIYLAAQLKAFKGKSKARDESDAHDYMWGMATLLEDPIIDGLARYFAAQKPAAGQPGDPALTARGKTLFEQGDPARGVPACASCHGAAAQGNSIFPRLAGQHAAYVVRQIEAIQHEFRASPVMHGVVGHLDGTDVKAVAEYVQSL